MGVFASNRTERALAIGAGAMVTILNILFLYDLAGGTF
jgi:hypothetical protein